MFDYGNRKVVLHAVQVLCGNLQAAAVACTSLGPELGALYEMLGRCDQETKHVRPRGNAAVQDSLWEEFWQAIEAIRVLVDEPSVWAAHFTCGLAAMLAPRERLALPGEMERAIWTGGDSTLDMIGAADWDAKVFGTLTTAKTMEALTKIMPVQEDRALIIAVAELLCLALLAAQRGEAWQERLVI